MNFSENYDWCCGELVEFYVRCENFIVLGIIVNYIALFEEFCWESIDKHVVGLFILWIE